MTPRVAKPKVEPTPKSAVKRRPRTTKPQTPPPVPPPVDPSLIGDIQKGQPKHAGGRPSIYTEELVASICKDLEIGNMRRAVAAMNGINKDTITDWMNKHSEFSARVRKAEAIPEYRCVVKIMMAQPGWQASAWWLERKWHEDWGKRERVDMVVDTRKSAEKVAAELGLPTDAASIQRLVDAAEKYATNREE